MKARVKRQIHVKECNQKSIKVAANSNVPRKRKHLQQLNSESGLREQGDFLHHDYISRKVFRKDGPPLGVEFDDLPSHSFRFCNFKDSRTSRRACQEKQLAVKRRKTSNPTNDGDQTTPPGSTSFKHVMGKGLMTVWQLTNQEGNSVKRHGIGKRLMTIQRVTDLGDQNLPPCFDNHHGTVSQFPSSTSQKQPTHKKKKSRKQPVTRRLVNKVQEKKSSVRIRKKIRRQVCEIALVGGRSEEDQSQYVMLVDDEELELRELQETSNPLTCCSHCAVNRLYGCSLCKDLLAKFPPNSVRMKQPLHMQPWDSSPQLVKKLFKIFNFVSTYAVIISIQSFTFDELVQAFIDKDSLLLGKLNIALLKLLLTGIEKELEVSRVASFS